MPGKRSTKKTAPKKRGLPTALSLRNRKFVVLLVLILGFASYGSYKLYSTSAAYPKRAFPYVKECRKFDPFLYKGVPNQSACVKTVQAFYNRIRPYNRDLWGMWPELAVDGIFGDRTKLVTAVFQGNSLVDHGGYTVNNNGAVDYQTWTKITDYCYIYKNFGVLEWCGYPPPPN